MRIYNWKPPDQPSAVRYPLKKWLLIKYLLVSIISESESRAARLHPASSGTWAAANSKHHHGIYSGIISRQHCTDLGGNQSCCQSQREMREVWIWVYAPLQNKISNVLNAAPTHQHPMAQHGATRARHRKWDGIRVMLPAECCPVVLQKVPSEGS